MDEAKVEHFEINDESKTDEPKEEKRVIGKIIKVHDEGYGFISTREIPFTRIFFHWSALVGDTLKFTELKVGMKVSCVAFEIPDKGWRAIKIKVEE